MAKLTVVTDGQDHLESLDDEWISCKGDRHAFPKLKVGKLDRGISARAIRSGVYQLEYTCPDCGTVRTKTTLRGGIIASSIKYTYKHPSGYIAPPGAGLTKADYSAELGRRAAPFIRDAARRETEATA